MGKVGIGAKHPDTSPCTPSIKRFAARLAKIAISGFDLE